MRFESPLVLVLAISSVAGCTLVIDVPPAAESDAGAGNRGGSGGSVGTGGASTGGASTGGASTGGASTGGASTGGAGGLPPGCSADCDCDGDGVQAETCGGGDCDDDDPNVFAGQDTYFPTPSLRRQFDYDCNGTSDPDPALDRRVDCTLGLVNCDEAQQGYFANAPACGVAAPWGRCKRGTLLCEQNVLDNRVMQCK